MTKVNNIKIRVIYNSFGEKTIEAIINEKFSASSSGGISRSLKEAKIISPELAIKNFEKIKKEFLGDFSQEEFDKKLKENENLLGGIATTSLSMAFFSMEFEMKYRKDVSYFPNLLVNVLGGGKHSFLEKPEIQEILVMPNAKSIREAIETAIEIWLEVRNVLKKKKILCGLNPEDAWLANITNEEALEIVENIVKEYKAKVGIDFAASSLFKNGYYIYHDKKLTKEEQIDYVIKLIKDYNLFYVEDPLEENDEKGFEELSRKINILICGDDIIATKLERLKKLKDIIKAVIIKPNQAGNVSECLDIIKFSRKKKIVSVVSHRSTKTACTSEAKLATFADLAKFSVAGIDCERCNELLRIWEESKNPRMRKIVVRK
ncbi:MAG: hypothetical protein QXJ96_03400 [Candidatus Aenigmatarchaeota archaeon]|nr:hypothetical protein [Candidatus Aenigmarchaeota archaeon]